MDADEVVAELRRLGRPVDLEVMARYGISGREILGVRGPDIKRLARKLGRDHALARALWRTGIFEARLLAAMVEEPGKVTGAQMERWAKDFDSWAVCDTTCLYLFDRTALAYDKVVEWSSRDEEYVKRAAFALMAVLAVHDKNAPDSVFLGFLPIIERESLDDRRYVKKAVNWALRQVGKRNIRLNRAAVACGTRISRLDSRAARWIASDALRELRGEAVQGRLRRRGGHRARPPAKG